MLAKTSGNGANQILWYCCPVESAHSASTSAASFALKRLGASVEGENPKQPKWLSCDEVPDDVREATEQLPLGIGFGRTDFDVSDRRLRELVRHTFARMRKVKLPEAPSQQEIDDAVMVEQAQFYRAILNDGPWGMRAIQIEDGRRVLCWVRQRRIHPDFEAPTLFADATAQWDAVRQIIDCDQPPIGYEGKPWIDEDGSIAIDYDYPLDPVIGPIAVAKAATPHVSYRQVL